MEGANFMKKFFFSSCLFFLSVIFFNVHANDDFYNPTPPLEYHHKDPCCCPLKCTQYGSFYTKRDLVIAPDFAIPFDQENIEHSSGIEHINGGTDFIIKDPGIYRVIYSVSLGCKGNVALTLNGIIIPGSEIYIEKDDQLTTLALLIKICEPISCGNVLRVINNNPAATIWHDNNIYLNAGKGNHNVTAAIVIEKAAECCKHRKKDPCDNCEDPPENPCKDPCEERYYRHHD